MTALLLTSEPSDSVMTLSLPSTRNDTAFLASIQHSLLLETEVRWLGRMRRDRSRVGYHCARTDCETRSFQKTQARQRSARSPCPGDGPASRLKEIRRRADKGVLQPATTA